VPATGSAAGPYDGTQPFYCAVSAIAECDAAGRCERHLEDGANPTFIKVDVAGQAITAGGGRKSALKSVAHVDGALILHGSENSRGWNVTIDEQSGRMAAAIVENDYTFSLFGSCTLP
jgi:hypothetical protein